MKNLNLLKVSEIDTVPAMRTSSIAFLRGSHIWMMFGSRFDKSLTSSQHGDLHKGSCLFGTRILQPAQGCRQRVWHRQAAFSERKPPEWRSRIPERAFTVCLNSGNCWKCFEFSTFGLPALAVLTKQQGSAPQWQQWPVTWHGTWTIRCCNSQVSSIGIQAIKVLTSPGWSSWPGLGWKIMKL